MPPRRRARAWGAFSSGEDDAEPAPLAAGPSAPEAHVVAPPPAPPAGVPIAARPPLSEAARVARGKNAVKAQKGRVKHAAVKREGHAKDNVSELRDSSKDVIDFNDLAHDAPVLDDPRCLAKLIATSKKRSSSARVIKAKRIVNETFIRGQGRKVEAMVKPPLGFRKFAGVKRSFDTTSHYLYLSTERKYEKVCSKLGISPDCLKAVKKTMGRYMLQILQQRCFVRASGQPARPVYIPPKVLRSSTGSALYRGMNEADHPSLIKETYWVLVTETYSIASRIPPGQHSLIEGASGR